MEATAKKTTTVAAIDLGSNSFRLLIGQLSDFGWHPLYKDLHTVRLGEGLSQTSILGQDAIDQALAVLTDYKKILTPYCPDYIRACGTAALRIAKNSAEFAIEAEKALGVEIEVLSGKEEAQLTLNGTLSALDDVTSANPLLIIDVGGGSTELIYLAGRNDSPTIESISIGAILLTENLARQKTAQLNYLPEVKIFLAKICKDIPLQIIGTGGTATALAALDLGLEHYDAKIIQGHLLDIDHLDNIYNRLSEIPTAQRNFLPGLEQGRGDIIVAGIMIYKTILEQAGAQQMTVSDSGLLEGIAPSQLTANNITQNTKVSF